MNESEKQDYDLIIVGGGMVGLALARALAETSLSILLLEKTAERVTETPGPLPWAARVSALTEKTADWLEELDVGSAVADSGCPFRRMQVWDGEGNGSIGYEAADIHQEQLGWIVENHRVVAALAAACERQGNLTCLFGQAPTELTQLEDGRCRILLADGRQLRTRLLVGADGGRSRVREMAGFRVRSWEYGQQAIVTTVATEQPHDNTAWQRFLHSGPLAFLPLPDTVDGRHCCSIVWSCDTPLARVLMGLDDAAFAARLGHAFEKRLGDIVTVNPRFSFPLLQQHAVDYVRQGVALVGDAAHTLHPLAGQGANLGLADARELAAVIIQAARSGQNIGHAQVLSGYQRRRKAPNLGMMVAMEGFKRLFGRDDLMLRWLRNAGLNSVDNHPALKRLIMHQTTL